jgi:hypothetical protein
MDDHTPSLSDDSIDFRDLFRRLKQGVAATLGLTFLGLALGITLGLVMAKTQTRISTLRVAFGFPGAEGGVYPNGAKFQSDDLRAPDLINEALDKLGIQDPNGVLASRLRGSISVSGLIAPNIVKERDRLRASGQTLNPFFPDEYEVSLSLPQGEALESRLRGLFLTELVAAYKEKFKRTYVTAPPQFANAFDQLRNADFLDYELILNNQMQTLLDFLGQQASQAKQFRSPTNSLSFYDLLKQAELFTQIRMKEVLSLVYLGGLSKNRSRALASLDYQVRRLEDQEQLLREEQSVVDELLTKTQSRGQSYVLAAKTEVTQGDRPILDQGLIDSLLANDAYNLLVRHALDAGMALKKVQTEKALLLDRRKRLESFMTDAPNDQTATIAATQEALTNLEKGYWTLLENVRVTMEDYARQEYADAVRITVQARTTSWLIRVIFGAIVGCGAGFAFGLGLSLLDLSTGRPRPARTAT